MPPRPLCFVIMPFGTKPDPTGRADIDFNKVYEMALEPAIEAAGMEPIRADQERTGGIIHKPMFERLLLCDFALADLTTANANVFYELGVRHTARPSTTLTIFATHQPIPFDVNFLRSMPYELGEDNAFGETEAKALQQAVTERLADLRELRARDAPVDSPLFQLLGDWQPGDLARLKTDAFRDRVQLNEAFKDRLAAIRAGSMAGEDGSAALVEIRAELGALDGVDAGTLVDLMLTYRAIGDFDGMIELTEAMPVELQRQILVREQLGFAFNRRAAKQKSAADRAKALKILTDVVDQQGPNSETCGLIGRIHKDNWAETRKDNAFLAAGHLTKAIESYVEGFMADQRDAYPGINALTLLDIKGDDASLAQKDRLLPIVKFAVDRRLEGGSPDYWDHATLLELAVLRNDPEAAATHLGDALAVQRETWEAGTTANNLGLIAEARAARGAAQDWFDQVLEALNARA